ncbi:MAG: T9SS type A sorting domain-containing protein [bacterium]|nr:T9SS type A sorting domain-containing protein [bacterium]
MIKSIGMNMKNIVGIFLLSMFFYSFARGYSSNLGNNYAGNPPANNSCVNCHSGTVNSGNGSMSILNLPTTYTPGQTYNLTLQLQDPGQSRWGFQLTVAKNSLVTERGGTIIVTNSTTTRLSSLAGNGLQFLNQTSQGNYRNTMNGPVNWNFQWTAPAAGTGTVTFYAAGLAANNNSNSSGDYTYVISVPVNEYQTNLPPNPFNLTSPSNGTVLRNNQVTLSWESNGGGANDTIYYVCYLSTDSLFHAADSFNTGTISSRIVSNLINNTTYYWKVRAYNQRLQSVWSNQMFHFTIQMYSPITIRPLLSFPENNSQWIHMPMTFGWFHAFDPDPQDTIRYSIHFSFRNYTYIYDVGIDSTMTILLDTIPPLQPNESIFWWVQAMSSFPLSYVESDTFQLMPYNVVNTTVQSLQDFSISSVYPNPFNQSTTVNITLFHPKMVEGLLYDIHGREVRRYSFGRLEAGYHTLKIQVVDLPSGIYWLTFVSAKDRQYKKLILLK